MSNTLYAAVQRAMQEGASWNHLPLALMALIDEQGREITGPGYERQTIVFVVSGHPAVMINCGEVTFAHAGAPWWKRTLETVLCASLLPYWSVFGWVKQRLQTTWPLVYGFRLYDTRDMLIAEGQFPRPVVVRHQGGIFLQTGAIDANIRAF